MDVKEVENAIETFINPKLLEHKGWIELEDLNDETAVIRFRGACSGCEGIQKTLDEFVMPTLQSHCPEIREVKVSEGVSQELYDLAVSLFTSKNK